MRIVSLVPALLAVAAMWSCAGMPRAQRPATVPMPQVDLAHEGERYGRTGRCLIVFLPGVGDTPDDFARHEFPKVARDAGIPCDMKAVDSHIGYFFDRSLVRRLREDVIAPARAHGYEQVWLAGISLGGLGSMLYASEHGSDISGIVLLSPYLGEKGIIADIERAGGVAAWNPKDGVSDWTGQLWSYIKTLTDPGTAHPPIYLAYGTGDRFVAAQNLLARVLPHENVFTADGGHNWGTWRELWSAFVRTQNLPHDVEAKHGPGTDGGGAGNGDSQTGRAER